MIGRGAVRDPLLFHRIRAELSGCAESAAVLEDEVAAVCGFVTAFYEECAILSGGGRGVINRLKQVRAGRLFVPNLDGLGR